MKKEYERFEEGTLFEGLVSLRVLIGNYERDPKIYGQPRRIRTVFYDRERTKKEQKEYHWLTNRAKTLGFQIEICDRAEIDRKTVGNTHGGVAVVCEEKALLPLSDDRILPDGFYMMLDGIEDPYNFGYALRSLYAFGVDAVILRERNWMSAAGVVCRASAGASELIPLYTADGASAAGLFRKKGYAVLCADLENAKPIFDVSLKKPIFLIVGGEKRGISGALLSLCDGRISVPYGRDFGASLSAASAASVIAFEVMRRNRT